MQLTFGAINLKDISILIGMLMASTGFYFSTTYRLADLEKAEHNVEVELAETQDEVSEMNYRLIRIEENVASMKEMLYRIENSLINE
jgi:hypothetical protein